MKQTNLSKLLFLALCLLTSSFGLNAQGWRMSFMSNGGGPFQEDGNYVTGVHVFPNDTGLVLVNHPWSVANYYLGDFNAEAQQSTGTNAAFLSENYTFNHFSRDLLPLTNDTIAILEEKMPVSGGLREIDLSLYHYDYTITGAIRYNVLWHKQVFSHPVYDASAVKMIETSSGGFVVLGAVRTSTTDSKVNPVLIKTNREGNVLWSTTLTDANHAAPINVVEAPDGGYFVLKGVTPNSNTTKREAWLVKTSSTGAVEWEQNISGALSDIPGDLSLSVDGNLLIAGVNQDNPAVFLAKTDLSGNALWRQDYALAGQIIDVKRIVTHSNGELAIGGNIDEGAYLMKLAADGTAIWEQRYKTLNRLIRIYELTTTADGGYVMGGSSKQGNNSPLAYVIKTDLNGIVKPGLITGNVFNDLNLNCIQNAGDIPIENWIVTAFRDNTRIFYGDTDADGNYRVECDTGNYVVTLTLPSPYWAACTNQVPVHIGYLDTAHVDFGIHALLDCAYMTVEHAVARLRPCDTTQVYVNYCNLGTVTADDAYMEIALDPLLTFVSGEITPSSIVNNVLTFPLGDMEALECAQFTFEVAVACNMDAGLVACSQAHIYPDSLCLPPSPGWSGAIIMLEGQCEGDSVRFNIKNIGTGPSQELEYIVIEDAVLLRQGSFQLPPQGTMPVTEMANGTTLHLMAQQEPGAPGYQQPIYAVEGCVGSSGNAVSTGFFNQFPQNDGDPFLSEWCQPVVNSYDPNDKQAFPTGFGEEHNIFANTDLKYMIRFQNTGTDTAFRVILLDTLSTHLNPATFRPGASSHPYTYELEDNGVLRFTFRDIDLPHAAVDEAGSNGFVSFRISQKKDNPVGTQITNRAGIYFDFNLPIMTNTVLHTIHEPLLEVLSFTQAPNAPVIRFNAYPNPFTDQILFSIQGQPLTGATLELYNLAGSRVRDLPFTGNTALLQREGLNSGMYFFVIRGGRGELLGEGKVVVNE